MLRPGLEIGSALVTVSIMFGVGFLMGFGFRRLRELIEELKEELHDRKVIEDIDSAIADDSPAHLKEKREAKVRRGEEPEDTDSQIVTTKSAHQIRAEADTAREAKLDKWMPGVKHGKG